ncbi:MAG: type II secretion system F family protein [Lachnospiraceae bacterium]|nr:type II secretion system F family protein [Lachnospiraceae bacterium]
MNYEVYKLKGSKIGGYILEYMAVTFIISYLFYDSIYIFLIFLPGVIPFMAFKRKRLRTERQRDIKREFIDMIMSVSAALSSGFSIENSFRESYRDMVSLHGKDAMISKELEGFFKQLSIGVNLEEILYDYGTRTGVEEIKDFAEIFVMAKRNGGDFIKMIVHTVNILKEKEDTENEIEVLLSGKKMEQRIMSVIPFVILMYLRVSTGGFLDILYHNTRGIFIMSVCLVIYIFAYFMAERITDIKV